jgi:hypothetical protein
VSASPVIHIVMFGWIPLLLGMFAVIRGHRAVAAAFLMAWLFLPMFGYRVPGFPDYTKVSATTVVVFLATILFESHRITRFRPHWFDLPMVVWCLSPFPASILNGLGAYDAVSDTVNQIITWGLPYFLGRIYFADLIAQRDFAIGLALAGAVYVPLCLLEIKMSPQLHNWVYGYHQHDFAQTYRFGGWRPTVFMQHGLAVATFMATASLAAFWLWISRACRTVWGIPVVALFLVIFATTVLCKSALSFVLLMGGMGALLLLRYAGTRLAVVALLAVPMIYIVARTFGGWDARELLDIASLAGHERYGSLKTRLDSETLLWQKAAQRPIFGWGGWGRSRLFDAESGRDVAISDGLWVILAGKYGVVGLAAFWGAMIVGVVRLMRVPGSAWRHPALAGAVVMSTLLVIHMADNLMNAMINPIFVLGAGGLAGLQIRRAAAQRAVLRPVQAQPFPAPASAAMPANP